MLSCGTFYCVNCIAVVQPASAWLLCGYTGYRYGITGGKQDANAGSVWRLVRCYWPSHDRCDGSLCGSWILWLPAVRWRSAGQYYVESTLPWRVSLCLIRHCLHQSYSAGRALNGTPSHSYRVSLVIWDHTVLPFTQHKWTHPTLTQLVLTYPEGWKARFTLSADSHPSK